MTFLFGNKFFINCKFNTVRRNYIHQTQIRFQKRDIAIHKLFMPLMKSASMIIDKSNLFELEHDQAEFCLHLDTFLFDQELVRFQISYYNSRSRWIVVISTTVTSNLTTETFGCHKLCFTSNFTNSFLDKSISNFKLILVSNFYTFF